MVPFKTVISMVQLPWDMCESRFDVIKTLNAIGQYLDTLALDGKVCDDVFANSEAIGV